MLCWLEVCYRLLAWCEMTTCARSHRNCPCNNKTNQCHPPIWLLSVLAQSKISQTENGRKSATEWAPRLKKNRISVYLTISISMQFQLATDVTHPPNHNQINSYTLGSIIPSWLYKCKLNRMNFSIIFSFIPFVPSISNRRQTVYTTKLFFSRRNIN